MNPCIGFIGAGNMARGLAGGLIQNGWPAARILLSDRDAHQRESCAEALGVRCVTSNAEVVAAADVLVLAVKPQVISEVAQEIAPTVAKRRPLVISVVAGVRTQDLERWLAPGIPIVRVMPNTPALINAGASGLFSSPTVSDGQRDLAESLLRSVGVAVWVETEALMDVVTALSGSGPAYYFLLMEALEAAAIRQGLDPKAARLLTLQTAYGAAKMALEGGEEPAVLRQRVTSPGGTTERAIAAFEEGGLRALVERATDAAAQRATELGDLFGKNS